MILNGNTIKELFKKNLLVENGNIDNIHSSSYDVTSSEYILKIKKSKKDSHVWNRPAKMFFEEIDPNKKGNITKQKHRFEIVSDLTKDYTEN